MFDFRCLALHCRILAILLIWQNLVCFSEVLTLITASLTCPLPPQLGTLERIQSKLLTEYGEMRETLGQASRTVQSLGELLRLFKAVYVVWPLDARNRRRRGTVDPSHPHSTPLLTTCVAEPQDYEGIPEDVKSQRKTKETNLL